MESYIPGSYAKSIYTLPVYPKSTYTQQKALNYYQGNIPSLAQAVQKATTKASTPVTSTTSNDAALVALAAQTQPVSYVPSTPAISYAPAPALSYTPAPYNVNLPKINWSFTPSAAQQAGWQQQAAATAAQEIDPQLLAIKTALDQYLVQGQNVRNELNPRYTNQSLGIANIIQNSVKQEAINNAIRRGAEQSGWLPSALIQAGQLETEQRANVEANRNMDLNALAALEQQQIQATGQQNIALEKLRGQRTTTALQDLENQAWQRYMQQKQNEWNAALGGEQLRASSYGANAANQLAAYQTQAGIGQSEADRALRAAIASTNQANEEWQQNYTTSQDAYNRALQAAQARQAAVKKTPLGYVQGIPYYNVNELNTLYKAYGLGGYESELDKLLNSTNK